MAENATLPGDEAVPEVVPPVVPAEKAAEPDTRVSDNPPGDTSLIEPEVPEGLRSIKAPTPPRLRDGTKG